uniref:SFRICE_039556 n=1 Tax=Spodoptera frugiperda TaxID=7108 RepID=A0A2H1W3B6_SPOFR
MELLLSKQQGVRQLPQLPQEAGVSNRTENASRSQANQQQDNAKSAERVDKLGDMIKKQTINFRAFKRTVATIEVEKLQNKWEFEDALKCLQSRWVVIDNLHWEIEGENGDENMWYQNEFSEHEKIYNDLKKTINSKMWSETHRDKSTPKMDIPVFQD